VGSRSKEKRRRRSNSKKNKYQTFFVVKRELCMQELQETNKKLKKKIETKNVLSTKFKKTEEGSQKMFQQQTTNKTQLLVEEEKTKRKQREVPYLCFLSFTKQNQRKVCRVPSNRLDRMSVKNPKSRPISVYIHCALCVCSSVLKQKGE
jgi:hypothetical protein